MGHGKKKGAAFELHVVKLIRKAIAKRYDDDVCFRTPRSGGHPIIGGADIIIKPRLRKIFPFAIECKHRKTIKIEQFLKVNAQTKAFLKQTMENTFESDDLPLLVVRGTRTPILAISTVSALQASGYGALTNPEIPGFLFRFRSKTWKGFLIEFLMAELKTKVSKQEK